MTTLDRWLLGVALVLLVADTILVSVLLAR